MNTKKFTLEKMYEVWDDNDAYTHWEIGPDRDGLGLVEIRQKGKNHNIETRMTLEIECAERMSKALEACAKDLKEMK